MKVLVTGGAGFIGSHIVDRLVRDGAKVRILDNFSVGRLDNLKPIIKKIDLMRGDIRDIPTVKKAVRGVKYIIHEAAMKSVPESLKRPEEFNDVNVNGTLNIIIQAQKANVNRLVFASSSSVYGDVKILPQKESFIPAPISPYGATKLIGETYCRTFSRIYRMEIIALRYFNVFGPRQDPDSPYAGVIIKFINAMLKDKQPIIFGDGKQSRDFTYIDNVVAGTLACLKTFRRRRICLWHRDAPKGILPTVSINGLVLNIASSNPITVVELVRILDRILKKKIKPIFTAPRKGDIKHSYADISLAKKHLGYKTIVSLEQGLIKTIAWIKQNN